MDNDNETVNILREMAKVVDSQKVLTAAVLNDIKAREANKPAVMHAAAMDKRQQRRNNVAMQYNMMGLATGGRVVRSLDNDDIMKPAEGLRTHGGSLAVVDKSREDKVKEMLGAFYGHG